MPKWHCVGRQRSGLPPDGASVGGGRSSSGNLSFPIFDRSEVGTLSAPLACGCASEGCMDVQPLGKVLRTSSFHFMSIC